MKTSNPRFLLVLWAGLFIAQGAWAQTKVATVNLQKVFEGYWKTKQANTQFTNKVAEFNNQTKDMLASYQKANEEYRKLLESAEESSLAAAERDKRKASADAKLREVQGLEAQYKQFSGTSREALENQRRQITETLFSAIQDVVKTKAKAASYTIVWDSSARSREGTPILLYSSDDSDLTSEVLAQLNKDAPAEFLKSAEAR